MSIRRLVLVGFCPLALLIIGCLGANSTEDAAGEAGPLVGKPAPEIVGKNSADETMTLSDYRGRVVMLDFWATWCPPCKAMFPHNKHLVNEYKDRPFVLLGVNVDDGILKLKDMETKDKLTWKSWWDGQSKQIMAHYQVRAYPTIYLIDHTGIVRYRYEGAPPSHVLDKAIEKLVAEVK